MRGWNTDAQHGSDQAAMRAILGRIGDKWSVLIVLLLSDGARRFTAIQQAVPGIARSVLHKRLIALERDGLVRLTPISAAAIHRGYELTSLGHSLSTAVVALRAWVQLNISAVKAARALFDVRQRMKQLESPETNGRSI